MTAAELEQVKRIVAEQIEGRYGLIPKQKRPTLGEVIAGTAVKVGSDHFVIELGNGVTYAIRENPEYIRQFQKTLAEMIDQAVDVAVRDERKACADIVDQYIAEHSTGVKNGRIFFSGIFAEHPSDAIRARK